MATKRKNLAVAAASEVPAAKRTRVNPGRRPQGSQHAQHSQHEQYASQGHPKHGALPRKQTPINPLKARIRSLTRLLAADESTSVSTPAPASSNRGQKAKELGADVRLARERELKALRHELETAERAEKRRAAIGKWHMVRFFDRKKAERRLRQAVRRARALGITVDEDGNLAEDHVDGMGGDNAGLLQVKQEVHSAAVDLKYTLYYPLERPYNSLWPAKDRGKGRSGRRQDPGDGEDEAATKEANDGAAQGDREMWRLVEKCMAEQRLEQLRSGDAPELKESVGTGDGRAVKAGRTKTPGNNDGEPLGERRARRDTGEGGGQDGDEDEGDSDGGFFE